MHHSYHHRHPHHHSTSTYTHEGEEEEKKNLGLYAAASIDTHYQHKHTFTSPPTTEQQYHSCPLAKKNYSGYFFVNWSSHSQHTCLHAYSFIIFLQWSSSKYIMRTHIRMNIHMQEKNYYDGRSSQKDQARLDDYSNNFHVDLLDLIFSNLTTTTTSQHQTTRF